MAFDQESSKTWALMIAQAEMKGKSIAAFDSIIAATAGAFDCKLVTRNVHDFAHAGIDVINPWQGQV